MHCWIGRHYNNVDLDFTLSQTKTGCLPDYIQKAPPNMKVCAVGIEHTPVGQITLCIEWHNQLTPMNFFILPKRVCCLIIGHNFMRRVHLNMHPGEGYFSCTRIPGLIIPYVPYSEELSQDPNWDEKLLTGSNCTTEQRLALKEVLTSVKNSKESTNKDGLLVYFNPTFDEELNDSGNGFKAVVPRSLIRRVMFACHGHPLSDAGISKTIHRTKQIYYWPKMSRHIRVYVRSCQHCQQYKPSQSKKRAAPYVPHNMTYPWETICVDLCGPKPNAKGNLKWILVIIDQ
uniref:Integrase zinc-binding domain-containing protein n=1 Tax=Strigamia maritima TaxID=126957 RepID=T1IHM8_STRMM